MTKFAQLEGHTAVVTGASSGIGRAIAVEFAAAGCRIIATCRRSVSDLEATCATIRSAGGDAEPFVGDLALPDVRETLIQQAWGQFGSISILVNNAGVDLLTGEGARLPYAEKLQRLFEIDIQATVHLSREMGRRMQAADGGSILTIGWDQADRGMEGDSGELFATAKNAIMGFTRSLAVSLAPAVRVNCIAPGWIQTAWGETAGAIWQERVRRETPLRRWGTPEDIAKAARFLSSRDAAFITGQILNVNGGAVR